MVDVAAAKLAKWKKTDASLCTVLWFSIAPNLQAQYQAFSTCNEVWEKAKKVFSNDVHCLYSVILKLDTLKLQNMDMQAYLSKLHALKASYETLMPYAKDATVHSEQQSKFFMVMALKGLPPELESVRNQILSGTTVPNYDAQLVNNCCAWLDLMHLVRFPLHLLLLKHQVTLLPLHLLATIRIAFEGHPTPNLIPSVTIVTGLDILSTVAESYMVDLHAR